MRARNLKPDFFKNEQLAECEPLARILFQGLWCLADREGYLEYRPKRIGAEVMPYNGESRNIVKFLDQLSQNRLITIWCVRNGSEEKIPQVIQVDNFVKHQNPHPNEKESEINKLFDNQELSGKIVKLHEHSITNRAESLLLNHESCILNPEGAVEPKSTPSKQKLDDEFNQLWQAYPKKKSKGQAEKTFKQLKKARCLPPISTVLEAIAAQKAGHDWQKEHGKYIPHLSTWLNAKGWEDEVTACTSANSQEYVV